MDKEKLKSAILIVVVIILGLFAMNLILKLYYNIDTASNPCEICFKINPELECRTIPSFANSSTTKIINNINLSGFNYP